MFGLARDLKYPLARRESKDTDSPELKLWSTHKEDPMKAFIFVLMTIVLSACATPSRHPLEEGGNQGDYQAKNGGPDRAHAGYFETAGTRH